MEIIEGYHRERGAGAVGRCSSRLSNEPIMRPYRVMEIYEVLTWNNLIMSFMDEAEEEDY